MLNFSFFHFLCAGSKIMLCYSIVHNALNMARLWIFEAKNFKVITEPKL